MIFHVCICIYNVTYTINTNRLKFPKIQSIYDKTNTYFWMVGTYMYVYSFLYFFKFFIIKYWSYLLLIQNHTCNKITLCSEPLSHRPHSFTTKSCNNDIHSRKHNAGIRITGQRWKRPLKSHLNLLFSRLGNCLSGFSVTSS